MKEFLCKLFEKVSHKCGKNIFLSNREMLFICLSFIFLLVMNYFLQSLLRFSLTYSEQWPGIASLRYVFFIQLFFFSFYFFIRRAAWYLITLLSFHFLILFFLLGIYITTGTFFCESILFLFFDTTLEETKGFISAYVSLKSLAILVSCLIIYCIGIYYLLKLHDKKKNKYRADFLVGTVVLVLSFPYFFIAGVFVLRTHQGFNGYIYHIAQYYPITKIYDIISDFNHTTGSFVSEIRKRKAPQDAVLAKTYKNKKVIGCLVIGESAIRSHHSIYGYERNTTPNLQRYMENIVRFDDVISVLPMTIVALKYLLTDMTIEHPHLKWTIFDALKKVGYKIDIITNQNKSGWADSPLIMMFSCADSIQYLHEENLSNLPEHANRTFYDEKILPHFISWLIQSQQSDVVKQQLAVLHLFGSHDPFCFRYPQSMDKIFFKDKSKSQLVNEYDTSILYTDKVLGRILEELSKVDCPAYLIYLSDHGAVCDAEHLRTPNSVANSAYEIPFWVWTNKEYQKAFPQTTYRIKKAVSVPLQTDRAHYGLLEIMGVVFPQYTDENNFLSPHFKKKQRTILEGRVPYNVHGKYNLEH